MTKGFDIDETNEGKVLIGQIAIWAIGEVQHRSPPKKRVIFHDYK